MVKQCSDQVDVAKIFLMTMASELACSYMSAQYTTRGDIFTSVLCAEVNMSPWVVYRGYGPTYHIIYTIYYGECATDEPFPKNASRNDAIFAQKVHISDICDHFAILKFLWLRNHHGLYVCWSIASIYDPYISSYISAMDLPTVLYI